MAVAGAAPGIRRHGTDPALLWDAPRRRGVAGLAMETTMNGETKLEKAERRGGGGRRGQTLRVLRGGAGRRERSGAEWQLDMFRFSLKKQQKLDMLIDLLGPLDDERCVLITCGDNPGALNYHLGRAGGTWTWVELEAAGIAGMEELLEEPVHHGRPDALPLPGNSFERVVVMDVHVRLEDVAPFNREIARLLAPNGVAIITTPNGDPRLPLVRAKRWIGMGCEVYGHRVHGYTTQQLEEMVAAAGLRPLGRGACIRFFTELAELAVHFGYVKLLARGRAGVLPGAVAPRSEEELRSVAGTYRLYRGVYPLVRSFAALDIVIPGRRRDGYSVAVAALKAD
jgi:SAM-dependent methyltransferase